MSKITDYSFLFHSMFGTKSTKGASAIGSFQLSQLNSSSVQAQLRAAGIDTNSKQYKAAIKQMMSNANGAMYGNIQGIKNLMKSYDKDGDYIDPTTGLAGLLVTEENEGSRKRIINGSFPFVSLFTSPYHFLMRTNRNFCRFYLILFRPLLYQ